MNKKIVLSKRLVTLGWAITLCVGSSIEAAEIDKERKIGYSCVVSGFTEVNGSSHNTVAGGLQLKNPDPRNPNVDYSTAGDEQKITRDGDSAIIVIGAHYENDTERANLSFTMLDASRVYVLETGTASQWGFGPRNFVNIVQTRSVESDLHFRTVSCQFTNLN